MSKTLTVHRSPQPGEVQEEVTYVCPKGDPRHVVTVLIPVQYVVCGHGLMVPKNT